jgi:FkbM family methyltransferase
MILDNFKYYYKRFGIVGVLCAVRGKFIKSNVLIKVHRKNIRHKFYLRFGTSDIETFNQIFENQEYDFVVQESPKIIVDAGANVGLASLYFANRFSEAKIFSIEPELSNYKILKMNIASYSNIIPINAALWNRNEEINVVDPGFNKWGFMTLGKEYQEEKIGKVNHKVQGITVDKIIEDNEIEKIDIMKMDIEGAEREVFMDVESWIGKVDVLIVELHERMKLGCNSNFYNGTKGFNEKWKYGENVYLSRRKGLIKQIA